MSPISKVALRASFICAALLIGGNIANAQYLGLNLRGDVGLLSGSQPAPGYYFLLPLYYRSDYDSLRDRNGDALPGSPNIDVSLFAPVIAGTTKFKVGGANYGFQIVPIVMNQRLNLPNLDIASEKGYGYGDMFIQPLSLGWHTKRADFLAGYGFYAPTGAGDRTLDMWAHELIAGTTLFLNESKTLHVATTMFYDINQGKRSSDIKVGDYLTLEGGMGFSFIKGAASAGVAYVVQVKTTADSGTDLSPLATGAKNQAYGVGPEINFPIFAKGKVLGLIGARYTFEFGNTTNFQGNNLVVSFTLAKLN